MSNLFFSSLWPGLTVWAVLYIGDYYLTIRCARLYRAKVREMIGCDGSYEITPYFQRDIDSLKRVSPRFLVMLVLNCALLAVVWFMSEQSPLGLYRFALGVLVLLQLTIHMRHLRNLHLYRAIVHTDEVRGRIEYSRRLVLRMSAVELFCFAGLYFVLFLFTDSWFFIGGSVGCLATALKHRDLARKYQTRTTNQEPEPIAL